MTGCIALVKPKTLASVPTSANALYGSAWCEIQAGHHRFEAVLALKHTPAKFVSVRRHVKREQREDLGSSVTSTKQKHVPSG